MVPRTHLFSAGPSIKSITNTHFTEPCAVAVGIVQMCGCRVTVDGPVPRAGWFILALRTARNSLPEIRCGSASAECVYDDFPTVILHVRVVSVLSFCVIAQAALCNNPGITLDDYTDGPSA